MSTRLDDTELKKLLPPPRDRTEHKRSFGRLQIVAGSVAYPGAGRLCALGAFKAGCGYIYLDTEAPLEIVRDLPELIPGFHNDADAFVIGPGLAPHWSAEQIQTLINKIPETAPLLIDGGALAFFSDLKLEGRDKIVITPHEGELAKILQLKSEDVQTDRNHAVAKFAERYAKVTLLLKGAETLVSGGGENRIMDRGTVAMATAGQGDLLSGVTGAYLALGLAPWRAALVASAVCAITAQRLAGRADQGVLAHEVAQALPETLALLNVK